jgi:hypothetical protein
MNIQTLLYVILFLISVQKSSLICPNLKGIGHMEFCEGFAHSLLIPLDCRVLQVLMDAYEFLIDSSI